MIRIVKAPKRAAIRKVVLPSVVGEIICISGLMVTYLMSDGKMETVCLM